MSGLLVRRFERLIISIGTGDIQVIAVQMAIERADHAELPPDNFAAIIVVGSLL